MSSDKIIFNLFGTALKLFSVLFLSPVPFVLVRVLWFAPLSAFSTTLSTSPFLTFLSGTNFLLYVETLIGLKHLSELQYPLLHRLMIL